jgi:uncharacterized repeat protein (TIGR03806 family)
MGTTSFGTLAVLAVGFLAVAVLTGCGSPREVKFFGADAYPERLSEWGVVHRSGNRLLPGDGTVAYDLNAPLFTDYAQKLRTIHLPPGTAAGYHDSEAFDFPVGTIISKTFFYRKGERPGLVRASYQWSEGQTTLDLDEVDVLETRLLVRQEDGWDALPYVWRGDDAVLTIAGTMKRLEIGFDDGTTAPLPYIVPTRNECAACHATDHTSGELEPIGPRARHLNRAYLGHGGNQLEGLAANGQLTGLPPMDQVPANADLAGDHPIEARARAYLDANCGHCHSPKGAADTSGLWLDASTTSTRALGICKPPIAAGQGTGGRTYSIVPGAPGDSILLFRMETDDPGARMPELGRSLVHREGVGLIREWIAGLGGECVERSGSSLTGE